MSSGETLRLSHSAAYWVALTAIAVGLSTSAGAAPTVQDAELRIKTAEAELTASKAALSAAKLAEKLAKEKAPPSVETLQFSLPRLKQAPKIDGAIAPGEWDAAIRVPSGTGASNQGQPMRARPASVYFLGWDPEFIYVAQRLPLREGELPRRLNRKPQQDAVDPWEPGRNMDIFAPLCDVLCCHPYAHTPEQMQEMLTVCRAVQKKHGKPMLSNETVPGCLDDLKRAECARWTVRMMEDAGYGWMGWGMREGKAISTRRDRYDGNGLNGEGFHAWFNADGSLRTGLEFLREPPRFLAPWAVKQGRFS